MLKILFLVLIIIHGLIHLLGFVKAFKLGEISELKTDVSRPAGIGWLLCTLLFLLTAGLLVMNREWWMTGIAAVLLSQILIFISWGDARFGIIANVIIVAGIILGYGG